MYTTLRSYWKGIRNQDMFGHLITLNFNKRGNHHRTQVGGVISVFITFAIRIYVLINFKILIFMEQNKNSSVESLETIEQLGTVNYNETDHFVFYVLTNQITKKPIMLEDTKRYLDIYYEQINNDWITKPGTNTANRTRFETKSCV